jgi:hypothetical protein
MLSYSLMRATYPAYLVVRDFITQTIFTGAPNTVSRVPLIKLIVTQVFKMFILFC